MSQTTATVPTPVKPRRILDRAVVRFAGDSGDGMQLTGEQFTTEAAWAGNDIATLPELPGRDPGPGRHALRRLELPAPVRQPPGLHAGGPPRLPRGDEPRRPQGPPVGPQGGRAPHPQHERVREEEPGPGRLRDEPAGRPDPGRAVPHPQDRHHAPHDRRPRRPPAQREGEGPLQELLRARAGLVDLHAADRADARLDQEALHEERRRRRGEHAGAQGRLSLRRDRRDLRASATASSRPRWRPASTGA